MAKRKLEQTHDTGAQVAVAKRGPRHSLSQLIHSDGRVSSSSPSSGDAGPAAAAAAAAAAPEKMAATFQISVKKETFQIEVAASDTFADLQAGIAERASIAPQNQKVLFRGKRVDKELGPSQQLAEASFFAHAFGGEDGPSRTVKLKVIGSTYEEIEAAKATASVVQQKVKQDQERELQRLREKRPRRWKLVPTLNGVSSGHLPYGFRRIEPLPGLPNIERATKILHKLASDPGVVAVMKQHKFSIDCLTELYPKGKVGRSQSCLMGLNVNKGEKICLRIRTDDMQGFRKYLGIRDVLFHELTHQVHTEHDAAFFNFMSQLKKDADKQDWTKRAGRKLGGPQSEEFRQDRLRQRLTQEHAWEGGHDEDKYGVTTFALEPDYSFDMSEAFQGGKMLVGGSDLTDARDRAQLSPRSLKREQALIAVALRKSRQQSQQQQQQQQQQQTKQGPSSDDSFDSVTDAKKSSAPELRPEGLGATAESAATDEKLPESTGDTDSDSGQPAQLQATVHEPSPLLPNPIVVTDQRKSESSRSSEECGSESQSGPAAHALPRGDGDGDHSNANPLSASSTEPAPAPGASLASNPAHSARWEFDAQAAVLSEMGFVDAAANRAALEDTRGNVELAIRALVAASAGAPSPDAQENASPRVDQQIQDSDVSLPSTTPDAILDAQDEQQRDVSRKQKQLRSILRDYGLQQPALQLLLKITQNVLQHPDEERFKRINLDSKVMRRTFSSPPGGERHESLQQQKRGLEEALKFIGWKSVPNEPSRVVIGARPDGTLQWLLKECLEEAIQLSEPPK